VGVGFLSGVQGGVPRSVVPINTMVAELTVGGSRMFARWLLRKIEDSVRMRHSIGGSGAGVSHLTRVVIFGAGAAGGNWPLVWGKAVNVSSGFCR
jgi:FlaA1/EpsC-like NDP-sugar epimerase